MRESLTTLRRMMLVLGLALVALLAVRAGAAETAKVEARLLEDLKFLASDACEGRGITTKGINLAADYLAQKYKKAGLKPAGVDGTYFQPFSVTSGAKLAEGKLTLKGPQGQEIALEMGKHFTVVAFGGSGKVEAPVVFAGYGITASEPKYDDYADLDVTGKVVIILRRTPQQKEEHLNNFPGGTNSQHAALQNKAANAELHKAAAVLFVNDNFTAAESKDQLMDFNYTAQSREPVNVPLIHLRRPLANQMIRSAFLTDLADIEKAIDRDLTPRSMELNGWRCELETKVTRETTSIKNVIGVLEGNGPLAKETVVIGAHYDHLGYGGRGSRDPNNKSIHYGADDNASGTVSLLELARRFGEMPDRKGRRLVFMAFTGEESGLLGSAYYCRKPIFPLDSTVAMVNMDMVGRLRDDKLTIYGTGTAKDFSDLIDNLNKKYEFKISKVATGFGPSDHSSFYAKKIPVFHYFTGTHPEYHKPGDTVETVNVPGIRKITDMLEELVLDLSAREQRPEYVEVKGSARPGGPRGPRLGIMPNYSDENEGLLIDGVTDGLPAAKAGLKAGDRIVEIGGKPVKNVTGYMTVMGSYKRGDKFEVRVIREEKPQMFTVVLE